MQYNDYGSCRKNLDLNFLSFDVPRKQIGNKFSKEKLSWKVESLDSIGSQIYTYEY